jgi:putative inorganic carbon (HCO3(-)) transporter
VKTLGLGLSNTLIKVLLVILGIASSLAVGLLTSSSPLLVIGIFGFLAVAIFSFRRPEVATQAFIFLLYTNAASAAYKFHGVPFFVAALFPLVLALPFIVFLSRGEKLIMSRGFLMVLGFFLVQILGTIFAIDMVAAYDSLFTFAIEAVVIYFLITNVVRTRESLRAVVMMVMVSTIFMAFWPSLQFITDTPDNNYGGFALLEEQPGFTVEETLIGNSRQLRYSGPIGEKNRFAQTMLFLLVIALPQLFTKNEKLSWRALSLAALGFAAFANVLAFSRGGGVGFVLTFLIAVFLRIFSVRQIATLVVGAIIVLAIFPQYAARLLSLSSLGSLVGIEGEGIEETDGAIDGRMTEMLGALTIYAEHPIVGVGPEMAKFYMAEYGNQFGIRRLEGTRREHSLYLDILANNGTLGMLFFAGLCFMICRDLLHVFRFWQKRDAFIANTALGFMLAVICYLCTGIFLHFAYIRYFWTTIAIANAVVLIAKDMEDKLQEPKPKELAHGKLEI